PLEAACREFEAETGYELAGKTADNAHLMRFEPIATIYPSPGLSTERIHLFYLELDKSDVIKRPGGEPGENIRSLWLTLDELFDGLNRGGFRDAKFIVAAEWFRATRRKPAADAP